MSERLRITSLTIRAEDGRLVVGHRRAHHQLPRRLGFSNGFGVAPAASSTLLGLPRRAPPGSGARRFFSFGWMTGLRRRPASCVRAAADAGTSSLLRIS